MIRIQDLSVQYGDQPALQEFSLQIEAGECVLVTGPSGCGKSTLARVLCGLIPQAIPARIQGQVVVAGIDVRTQPISAIARQVGMVFQRPASQLFHLRVADEVAFGPRNLGLEENEVQQRTAWALAATGLTDLHEARPAALSGGQKQCLAIAAALAMQPRVLVLDEPTASLDVPNTRRVFDTLAHLRAAYGLTLVLIEHRLVEAAQLAERAVLMEAGRLVADGPLDEIFADRDRRQRLGLRRPAETAAIAWENLIQSNGSQLQGQPPLLSLEHVSAGYPERTILQDIQLNLYPGEFVALVGNNGAGKSTLGKVAAGLIKPGSGRVRFREGARPRPGRDVALLFQDPQEQLFTDSVDEEVTFGPRNYDRLDPQLHQQILQRADLVDLRARHPQTLSVGQQQRTALAACLGLQPDLLILDEPTQGQDWGHLQQLMDYTQAINQGGAAILLITHDYKLVHYYASRVVLLREGRIARVGKIQGESA